MNIENQEYAAKTFYEELKGSVLAVLWLVLLFIYQCILLSHLFLECNDSGSLTVNPITQQACESILHYMGKWLSADKRV